MRVLVTGNAGFMGSHLVNTLIAQGHEVHGIDDLSGGFTRNINPRCRHVQLDLSAPSAFEIVKGIAPDVLFHLAADATEGRSQFTPMSSTRRNLMSYINTLTGAVAGGVRKVVLTSSMSVYGAQIPPFSEDMPRAPEDVYAVNKASMERITEILASVHGFKYTIVRPHNVFGENQNIQDPYRNVIGVFMNRILNGNPPIIYGDGQQTRAFTHIDNFTPYLAETLFSGPTDSQIINIGPTEAFSINYVADVVLEAMGSNLRPIYYPSRPLEVKHAFCTVDKAMELLGYVTIVPLEEGIQRMANWAKKLGAQEFKYLSGLEIVTKDTPATWANKEM